MTDQHKIYWTSEDARIAVVDQDGNVTCLRPGSTTITARLYTADNMECLGAEAACDVTVKKVTTEIDEDTISVYVGQETDVVFTVEGPKKKCDWTSSDESIATVKNGTLKGIKPGTTTVSLNANNVTTTIGVTVEKINLTMESIGLAYGHYEGAKPQGDGAIPTQLDLYENGTFRLHCSFDLFSSDCTDHTYTGTYTVDRINEDGNPVLLFQSNSLDFEMVYTGTSLYHKNFFCGPID